MCRDVYARKTDRVPGGYLEDITMCVIREEEARQEL